MCSATNTRLRKTFLWVAIQASKINLYAAPLKIWRNWARNSALYEIRIVRSCTTSNSVACGWTCKRACKAVCRLSKPSSGNCGKKSVKGKSSCDKIARQRCATWASNACASRTRPCNMPPTGKSSLSASSCLPKGKLPAAKYVCNAATIANLFWIDNSILMRSIPSVYSPILSSGITTSSLILKALVCLEIAAVLARSNQNFLRDSGETAIKPSPTRVLAMRTTSDAANATAFSSSPTISPNNAILGNTPRLDLVL